MREQKKPHELCDTGDEINHDAGKERPEAIPRCDVDHLQQHRAHAERRDKIIEQLIHVFPVGARNLAGARRVRNDER